MQFGEAVFKSLYFKIHQNGLLISELIHWMFELVYAQSTVELCRAKEDLLCT